mmetsp:Transcript_3854/g.11238  ORF Transcript_3854/g.11238 Transcript_3854/m.11238 type:complete len:94 (-) Transcript_3854:1204-1485(-)
MLFRFAPRISPVAMISLRAFINTKQGWLQAAVLVSTFCLPKSEKIWAQETYGLEKVLLAVLRTSRNFAVGFPLDADLFTVAFCSIVRSFQNSA